MKNNIKRRQFMLEDAQGKDNCRRRSENWSTLMIWPYDQGVKVKWKWMVRLFRDWVQPFRNYICDLKPLIPLMCHVFSISVGDKRGCTSPKFLVPDSGIPIEVFKKNINIFAYGAISRSNTVF